MTDSARPFDAVAFLRALPPERREALAEAVSRTAAPEGGPAGCSHGGGSPNSPPPERAQSLAEFVERHELAGPIEAASRIAERHFILDSPIEPRLMEDAEAGDEWVALSVRARGEVPEVREAHRRYTREWLKTAPADMATKVRLSISLV